MQIHGTLFADPKWGHQILEYSGRQLMFKGANVMHNASTAADSWYIWKYTWTGEDITKIEKLIGIWDDRTSLSWAI